MTATRKLVPIPLTRENFAPYGEAILPAPDGAALPGHEADGLDLRQGRPRFYIMRLDGRGLGFRAITRHRRVTQCLASTRGQDWYLGVAPPKGLDEPDAKPALDDIVAFKVPGGVAIKLHAGTWHAGPFFAGAAMDFFNLELADTNEVDHHTVALDREYGTGFEFEV
ncbi:MAG: ureidoglycolate lyase [Tagaea sp.]|nr:ureidoglycolate lyase [Tagaea sp.]